MSTKRIVALVIGCVLLLPALGMLLGGGALALVYATQRNDDGYLDVTIDQLQTPTVAITGEDVRFAADPGSPDWLKGSRRRSRYPSLPWAGSNRRMGIG